MTRTSIASKLILAAKSKLVSSVFFFSLGASLAVIAVSRPTIAKIFSDVGAAWVQAILSAIAIAYSIALWNKERSAQLADQRHQAQVIDFRIAVRASLYLNSLQTMVPLVRERVVSWQERNQDVDLLDKQLTLRLFDDVGNHADLMLSGSITTIKASADVVQWADRFRTYAREFMADRVLTLDENRARMLLLPLDSMVEPLNVCVQWFETLRDHPLADKSYDSITG